MWLLLAFLLRCFPVVFPTPDQPSLTFEELYKAGKMAYTEGNWQDCVAFMRRALEDFRYLEDELVSCRSKCEYRVEAPSTSKYSQWHAESEKALCLLRCKRDKFTDERPELGKMTVYFDFMERKPYEYMHICYWNMKDLSLAVQSAYTFLVKNPGHKDVLDGLKFYMELDGYHDSMLVDALRMPYETKLMDGVLAYDDEDWGKCIDDLETSLEKLMLEDERCRHLCHDKIDWTVVEGNPELEVLFTSIRSSIIRCEHNCIYRLGVINGHSVGNPIAAIYEYLHYCQYKFKRASDACQSVATYLLFDDNPAMRRNKYFYLQQFNKQDLFTPHTKMLEVYKKRTMEERYLNFIEEKFKYTNNDFPPERVDDWKKLDEEVVVEDNFDYNSIQSLISINECKVLRSIFHNPIVSPLIEEIQQRVRRIWPSAKYEKLSCSSSARHANCTKAIVLSTTHQDCSEWLGSMHTGCSIVFCV